ncbi:MAG: hypothetical protein RLZZ333_1007, partial [Bacteroidota bacterium]
EWATFAIPSPDGGTGRRARLKIWLSQGSAGSIPVLGTNPTIPCRVFYLPFQVTAYQTKKTELVDPSSAIQQCFNPFTDVCSA